MVGKLNRQKMTRLQVLGGEDNVGMEQVRMISRNGEALERFRKILSILTGISYKI